MRLLFTLFLLTHFSSTGLAQARELVPKTEQFHKESLDLGKREFSRGEHVRIPAHRDSIFSIVGENYRIVELKLDEDFGHVYWHAGIIVELQANQGRVDRYLPYGTYQVEERDPDGKLLRTSLKFEIVPKKDE